MATFKKIMFYVIVIVVFAIFTDFIIKIGLKNTYRTISGEIGVTSPEIHVVEVKTTDVNGYAKGTIKNNMDENIDKIYIKIDLYSKRNVNLGTQYLEIKDLNKEETREFEIDYKYSKVNNYKITCVFEK